MKIKTTNTLYNFFFKVYALTAAALLTTFFISYLNAKYYYPELISLGASKTIISIIYISFLLASIFLVYQIQSGINYMNTNSLYIMYFLFSISEGIIITPILYIANQAKILNTAMILTLVIFTIFSLCGLIFSFDMNYLLKISSLIIFTISITRIAIWIAGIQIRLKLQLINSIIMLISVCLALWGITQMLKNLYHRNDINQDNLVIYGSLLLHQKFIIILIEIIRIMFAKSKRRR